jgi:hypothetical protein
MKGQTFEVQRTVRKGFFWQFSHLGGDDSGHSSRNNSDASRDEGDEASLVILMNDLRDAAIRRM